MVENNASKTDLAKYVNELRLTLNPHPAGQLEHNVPTLKGKKLIGIQHKYRETMLFFPIPGSNLSCLLYFLFQVAPVYRTK